jgi:hypothetical protein
MIGKASPKSHRKSISSKVVAVAAAAAVKIVVNFP